jgi:hypothetical protein
MRQEFSEISRSREIPTRDIMKSPAFCLLLSAVCADAPYMTPRVDCKVTLKAPASPPQGVQYVPNNYLAYSIEYSDMVDFAGNLRHVPAVQGECIDEELSAHSLTSRHQSPQQILIPVAQEHSRSVWRLTNYTARWFPAEWSILRGNPDRSFYQDVSASRGKQTLELHS